MISEARSYIVARVINAFVEVADLDKVDDCSTLMGSSRTKRRNTQLVFELDAFTQYTTSTFTIIKLKYCNARYHRTSPSASVNYQNEISVITPKICLSLMPLQRQHFTHINLA